MTYSIAARCPRTGQYGVRIATCSPNVGVRCPVLVPGRSAGATGSRNAKWAGHKTGEGYACAGNVMVGPQVVDAVAASFEASEKESLGMTRPRRNCAACGSGSRPWFRTASSVPGWKARHLKG